MSDPYSVDDAETFDPINFIEEQRRGVLGRVWKDIDAKPDNAVKAQQIANGMGVPGVVVHEDLDHYEQQYKTKLASDIVGRNQFIQNYITRYPLASSVSNDDWAQLDDFTQSAFKLGARSVLHKTFETFKEHFPREDIDKQTEAFRNLFEENPVFMNYWIRESLTTDARDIAGFFHAFTAAITAGAAGVGEAGKQLGLWEENTAARFARDLIVMANVGMSGQGLWRGPFTPGMHELQAAAKAGAKARAKEAEKPGTVKIGGVEYPPAALSEIKRVTNKLDPYLRDGEPPPAGLDAMLDEFWKDQAKNDAKNLKELEQKFDATGTAPRVPDEFTEYFVEPATENQKIGIKAEAIPPEDPALINIPGVKEQEAIARGSNGYIVIPISEWLKLDPEVRDKLRDHVRHREGGMTIDEVNKGPPIEPKEKPEKEARSIEQLNARINQLTYDRRLARERGEDVEGEAYAGVRNELNNLRQELREKLAEQPAPRFLSGDSAVDAIDDVGGFNNANPIQERKLNLIHFDTEVVDPSAGTFHAFDLVDDTGKRIGDLHITESRDGKKLTVEWVGAGNAIGEGIKAFAHRMPNGFGPRAIRDLLEQVRQEFPQAEKISGQRVTGAREGLPDAEQFVTIPLRGMSKANLGEFIETIPGWVDTITGKSLMEQARDIPYPPGANLTPHTFATHGGLTGNAIAVFKAEQALDHLRPQFLKGVAANLYDFFSARLRETVGDVTVRVVTQKEMDRLYGGRRDGTPGYYYYKTHDVVLSEDIVRGVYGESYAAYMLMHELAHAFTVRVVGTDTRVARDVMALAKEFYATQRLLDPVSVKDRPQGYANYALKDIYEFLAEAWSNPKFQEALAQVSMSPQLAESLGMAKSKGTIWDAVKHIIADMMQRLWGKRPTDTILDGILEISKRIEEQLQGEPTLLEPTQKFMQGRQWTNYIDEPISGPPREPELPMVGTTRIEDQPVFKQATAAGITAPMLKGWLKYIDKKFNERVNHDMEKVKADEARKQTKEWRENREAIMPDAAIRVLNMSDVQADEILRTGRWKGQNFGRMKLDPEGLSPEQRAAIPADYIASKSTPKDKIISKDDMAAMVKLPSGDILIERLAAYNDVRKESGLVGKAFLNEQIKREADRLMESKYGKLKENILRETYDRVVNDSQLDYMHEWLVGLAQNNKRELGFTKAKVMEDLQRQFDDALVGTITSKAYKKTAGDAIRGMTEQFIKENPAEALKRHTEQFFATVTAKIATKFEKAMEDFRDTAKKMNPPARKGVDQTFKDQIDRLLIDSGIPVHRTRAEIMDSIQKDAQRSDSVASVSLVEFVDNIQRKGYDVSIPEWLPDGGNIPRINNLKNREAIEFKELIDSLEHFGRMESKIKRGEKEEAWQDVKQEIIENIKKLPERSEESQGRWLYGLDAELTRVEEIVKDLDLRQELGPMFEAVIGPLMAAKSQEFTLVTELSKYFQDVKGNFDKKWRKSMYDDIPQDFLINPYNRTPYKLKRGQLINIMLNWGNPSSRWKFSAGQAQLLHGRRPTKEEIANMEARTKQLIDAHATELDWQYVAAMWEPFKKWQPMMDEVARATTGVSPRWIEGDVIKTPYGDVEGGYWPVKYSPYSHTGDQIKKKDDPDKVFGPEYFPVATSKSHLKERTKHIDAVDITTSLEQAAGTMQQAIHDISFREALIQATKVMTDKDIRQAARQHYGSEYVREWVPWLRRIANKNTVDHSQLATLNDLQWRARSNMIAYALPFNYRVLLSPDIGIPNPKAYTSYMANWSKNHKFSMENSLEIKHLVYNLDRDFRENFERISMEKGWTKIQRAAVQLGFKPIMWLSQQFREATFVDQYNKARATGRSHAEAVTIADYYVRQRHGAASIVDLPKLMAADETVKSMTMFYGYFNNMQQWARSIPGALRRGEWSEASTAFLGSYVVGVAFTATLFSNAKENESWFKTIGKAMINYPMQLAPIIGPFVTWKMEGFEPRQPLYSMLDSAYKLVVDAQRQIEGKKVKSPIKDAATFIGLWKGLPTLQAGRTAEFLVDVNTQQQFPRDWTEWLRGLFTGEARLRKR